MSDDYSLGDARKPYSDIGGPAANHAQSHGVRRQQLANPRGPEPIDTSFAEQVEPGTTRAPSSYADESLPTVDDKDLHDRLIFGQQTDYRLWNRLAGEDGESSVERPEGAGA